MDRLAADFCGLFDKEAEGSSVGNAFGMSCFVRNWKIHCAEEIICQQKAWYIKSCLFNLLKIINFNERMIFCNLMITFTIGNFFIRNCSI